MLILLPIAIIVLNWNNWQITLKCLESLLNLQLSNTFSIVIIICDNGSTDNSVIEISNWLKIFNLSISANNSISFRLLQNNTNLGYAAGMNIGIKYALRNFNPTFVWLLNNDTHVAADSLINLITCANTQSNIAIWGSTICEHTAPSIVKSTGGCNYNYWLTTYHALGYGIQLSQVKAWQKNPYLDYIDGSAWLIRGEVLNTVGLLNEDYFLYFEELDYAYRIRKHGWQLKWCRNSIVYHHGGQSVQQLEMTFDPRHTASYHADLSAFKFTWNYHRNILWIAMAARICGRIIKIALSGNWKLINSLWYAYSDFLHWQPSNNSICTQKEL